MSWPGRCTGQSLRWTSPPMPVMTSTKGLLPMRLDRAFRLSTCLTLAVASLCLAWAEDPFLPGMIYFGIVMLGILAAAFALEGRWSLGIRGANILGTIIAACAGLWMAYHFIHLPRELE